MSTPSAPQVQAEGQDPGDFITEAGRQSVASLRSNSQQVAEPGFEFQIGTALELVTGFLNCQ